MNWEAIGALGSVIVAAVAIGVTVVATRIAKKTWAAAGSQFCVAYRQHVLQLLGMGLTVDQVERLVSQEEGVGHSADLKCGSVADIASVVRDKIPPANAGTNPA